MQSDSPKGKTLFSQNPGTQKWKTWIQQPAITDKIKRAVFIQTCANLSTLESGVDFWEDVVPFFGASLKDISTENKLSSLRNIINAQGNKERIKRGEKDDFDAINKHYCQHSTTENVTDVQSYALEQKGRCIFVVPISADKKSHNNAKVPLQGRDDKQLYETLLERMETKSKERINVLINDMGGLAERSHLLSLLEAKLKGSDISSYSNKSPFTLAWKENLSPPPDSAPGLEGEQAARHERNARFQEGIRLREKGDLDEAISIFRKELESGFLESRDLDVAKTQYMLGKTLADKKGNDAEAIQLLQAALGCKAFQDLSKCVQGAQTLGRLQMERWEHADAVQTFQQLEEALLSSPFAAESQENPSKRDVRLAAVRANMGRCLMRLGKHKEAIEPLQKAVNSGGYFNNDSRAWTETANDLAHSQVKLEKYDLAGATFETIAKKGAWTGVDLAIIHMNHGNCHFFLKEYEKATEASKKAVASEDFLSQRPRDWTQAARHLALWQRKLQLYDAADTTYKTIVKRLSGSALEEAYADFASMGHELAESKNFSMQEVKNLPLQARTTFFLRKYKDRTSQEAHKLHQEIFSRAERNSIIKTCLNPSYEIGSVLSRSLLNNGIHDFAKALSAYNKNENNERKKVDELITQYPTERPAISR